MTEVPFIETLVAKESSEDESDDRSRGNQLQNDGVVLQLCKIRCMPKNTLVQSNKLKTHPT